MSRDRLPAGASVSSFAGVGLRSLRARPLRSILTTAGIVLGVGMVFGVLLLTNTIHGTFDRLFDSIYGDTDIVVSGEQSIGSVPESTLDKVTGVPGVEVAAGKIFSAFRLVDERGRAEENRSSQLFVAGESFEGPDTTGAKQVEGREPVAGPEVQVDRDWAREHGIEVGEALRLAGPTGVAALRVVGLYEFPGGLDLGGYGSASIPVDEARRIMDKPGVWDEVSIIVDDGSSTEAVSTELERILGDGVDVTTPATKGQEAQDQLAGLDIVLYFFAGTALFVGAFLILNAFSMTVLQRIREIGTLRALGASRGKVVRSVLGEALLLAVAGSIAGLGLGLGLAVLLIEGMRSFGLPVGSLELSAGAAVAAVITGLAATTVGALWPAVRAGRIPPIRALIGGPLQRSRPGWRRAALGALLFLPGLVGGGLFWFSDTAESGVLAAVGGIGATVTMFMGMVLLAPFVVMPIAGLLAWPMRRLMPAEGRLAADSTRANPGRTSATAAALLVALSVVVVNATMAQSFVGSVSDELDKRFARDLTVQPIGYTEYGAPQPGITSELRERIAALPEAGAVARRRAQFMPELPAGGPPGLVGAFEPSEWSRVDRGEYKGASREDVLAGIDDGGVAPSEAYANDRGLDVGDRLQLRGPGSTRRAHVVGIADTLDGGGQALHMSLDTMAGVYGIQSDSQLAITAASPDDRGPLVRKVEQILEADYPGLESVSNAELKEQHENEINQQFAFFNAIVGIAVIVGLLGIVNTLSMSVLERTREIGVLRALGASRWTVRRTMADESLLISLSGTLAGIGAGLLVAIVWLLAMRGATFPGLSIQLPTGTLLTIAVLGVVMGVLAAILPARRAAKLDPLSALSYE